jgi:hypothetical protein
MTVEIDTTRKAINLSWDTTLVDGEQVDIRCVNPDNEDISTRDQVANDGQAVVTFPSNYSGECQVSVTGSDSGEDTGTIQV